MIDRLWQRARDDLCVMPPAGPADPVVFDHGARVCDLAIGMLEAPELARRAVDRTALAAAALYHDAGWVVQANAGEIAPGELLLRATSDSQRELAADVVEARLRDVLPPESVDLAARAVLYAGDRLTELLEAQVVCEACHLDAIGPQALGLMIRKQIAEGRLLADIVGLWERQEEYHYWQARIKEGFRFPSVRRVAEQRWQAMRAVMAEIRSALKVDASVFAHTARPVPKTGPQRSSVCEPRQPA